MSIQAVQSSYQAVSVPSINTVRPNSPTNEEFEVSISPTNAELVAASPSSGNSNSSLEGSDQADLTGSLVFVHNPDQVDLTSSIVQIDMPSAEIVNSAAPSGEATSTGLAMLMHLNASSFSPPSPKLIEKTESIQEMKIPEQATTSNEIVINFVEDVEVPSLPTNPIDKTASEAEEIIQAPFIHESEEDSVVPTPIGTLPVPPKSSDNSNSTAVMPSHTKGEPVTTENEGDVQPVKTGCCSIQ